MTMHDLLTLLIGASLVMLGVLTSAVADRVRAIKAPARDRRTADRDHAVASRTNAPRTIADARLRTDVISALTTCGYARTEALEAIDECSGSERATIESWTRAALRRLAPKAA
jgi:RuvA, C-terminal domain